MSGVRNQAQTFPGPLAKYLERVTNMAKSDILNQAIDSQLGNVDKTTGEVVGNPEEWAMEQDETPDKLIFDTIGDEYEGLFLGNRARRASGMR